MDKLQELFNFTNADGEVLTLFDGKITVSQLVVILLAVAVVIFALKVLKTAARVVTVVIAVCACLVHFNIASPSQIRDVAGQIASVGVSSYQSIVDSSKNIKIEDGGIKICLDEDTWVDVSEISSIVGGDSGKATLTVNGQNYVVDDSVIIQLIKSFT